MKYKNIKNVIKQYNETHHFAYDLNDDELFSLDESEVDYFISWAIHNKYGDYTLQFYKK